MVARLIHGIQRHPVLLLDAVTFPRYTQGFQMGPLYQHQDYKTFYAAGTFVAGHVIRIEGAYYVKDVNTSAPIVL